MRRIRVAAMIPAFILIAGMAVPAALADSAFEFLFDARRVKDDDQLFLNLAVKHFGAERDVLEPLLPGVPRVGADLPVVLFLAGESGRSLESIVKLRSRDLSWSVIFGRVEVPMDKIFVGFDRDPGPPYGKAYGHWKKDPKGAKLSDDEIQGLVQVQIGNRVAGISPMDLINARLGGGNIAKMVADKKGRPHEAGAKAGEKGKPPSKAKGKSKPRDKR